VCRINPERGGKKGPPLTKKKEGRVLLRSEEEGVAALAESEVWCVRKKEKGAAKKRRD